MGVSERQKEGGREGGSHTGRKRVRERDAETHWPWLWVNAIAPSVWRIVPSVFVWAFNNTQNTPKWYEGRRPILRPCGLTALSGQRWLEKDARSLSSYKTATNKTHGSRLRVDAWKASRCEIDFGTKDHSGIKGQRPGGARGAAGHHRGNERSFTAADRCARPPERCSFHRVGHKQTQAGAVYHMTGLRWSAVQSKTQTSHGTSPDGLILEVNPSQMGEVFVWWEHIWAFWSCVHFNHLQIGLSCSLSLSLTHIHTHMRACVR